MIEEIPQNPKTVEEIEGEISPLFSISDSLRVSGQSCKKRQLCKSVQQSSTIVHSAFQSSHYVPCMLLWPCLGASESRCNGQNFQVVFEKMSSISILDKVLDGVSWCSGNSNIALSPRTPSRMNDVQRCANYESSSCKHVTKSFLCTMQYFPKLLLPV